MLPFVTFLPARPRSPHIVAAALALLGPASLIAYQADQSALTDQVAPALEQQYTRSVATVPETHPTSGYTLEPVSSEQSSEELLWLARCIYSETKRPVEQLLVAWVIRNRVETQYRGNTSYRGVVLDPYQFSAFNRGSYSRTYYSSLGVGTHNPQWQQALSIARYVMHAPPSERPFSIMTRHFYSAQSMNGSRPPHWARDLHPVQVEEHMIDTQRFRFYTGVL